MSFHKSDLADDFQHILWLIFSEKGLFWVLEWSKLDSWCWRTSEPQAFSLCSFGHVLFCVLLENKFSFKINFKVELRMLVKRENKEKLFSFDKSD